MLTFSDNHMINGTKLLNVAGMTRGRRDGILKSEKTRHVVKIGPMHLKGVWYGTCVLRVEAIADFSKDPLRPCARLCKQGEDHRNPLPPLRAQHWCFALPPHKPEPDQCSHGRSRSPSIRQQQTGRYGAIGTSASKFDSPPYHE